jgi:Ca2+ transporting ATPase
MKLSVANLLALSLFSPSALAFTVYPQTTTSTTTATTTSLLARQQPQVSDAPSTRRKLLTSAFTTTAAGLAFSLFGTPQPAYAAANPPTQAELQRIVTGYNQITDLLNNFEEATTTCRENGGECKRDADPIRKVLGLRSTTDPLFQIEKVLDRVKYMDDLDPDKLETFFQATEDWNSAITMSNSMAFIAQFGEYNPGGGKDEVLKYLNESKKQVVLAQKALKTIMESLDLQ